MTPKHVVSMKHFVRAIYQGGDSMSFAVEEYKNGVRMGSRVVQDGVELARLIEGAHLTGTTYEANASQSLYGPQVAANAPKDADSVHWRTY